MNTIWNALASFVGINDTRVPEGPFSWQHLLLVGTTLDLMVFGAVYLGLRNRNKNIDEKCKPLIITAFLIDGCELARIILSCIINKDPMGWLNDLPLFLCSIQFFTIPIAAFCKGRIRQIALDFILIFGILGAVAGTIGAIQNYTYYPVLSMKNVVSSITHAGAGFAGLYIPIAKMHSMKKRDIPWVYGILIAICIVAYIVNFAIPGDDGIPRNYMFLIRSDGTPYFILEGIFGVDTFAYSVSVVLVFVLYITLFYGVYHLVIHKNGKTNKQSIEISL